MRIQLEFLTKNLKGIDFGKLECNPEPYDQLVNVEKLIQNEIDFFVEYNASPSL
jgi:hypothetical protein